MNEKLYLFSIRSSCLGASKTGLNKTARGLDDGVSTVRTYVNWQKQQECQATGNIE